MPRSWLRKADGVRPQLRHRKECDSQPYRKFFPPKAPGEGKAKGEVRGGGWRGRWRFSEREGHSKRGRGPPGL